MARHTGIQWTDATLNVFRARATKTGKTGWHCEHVSEACRFCYAEAFNRKLGTGYDYKPGHLDNGDIEIYLDVKALLRALTWRGPGGRPLRIFLHSMTDTFGRFITDEMLRLLFAVLYRSPHIIQILTKRPDRLHAFMTPARMEEIARDADDILAEHDVALPERIRARFRRSAPTWPWPHLWLGTTVENQSEAENRLRWLMMTPAALRFVSYEPALGLVDWTRIDATGHGLEFWDALRGTSTLHVPHSTEPPIVTRRGRIHLIIGGGESGGPTSRPSRRTGFLETARQCEEAGATYYHKQNGDWLDALELGPCTPTLSHTEAGASFFRLTDSSGKRLFGGRAVEARNPFPGKEPGDLGPLMFRVGVDAAGHLLGGKEYRSLPA